jgi:hypothetical protein
MTWRDGLDANPLMVYSSIVSPCGIEMAMDTRKPMGFYPLGYEFGQFFISMGLLMGINLYPTSSWVRVCSYSTQTREPMCFLNPTKPSAYCYFIL